MTDPTPTRPSTSTSTSTPAPAPARPRLLTREQVISALREERGRSGLTATARRYDLAPQQVADVLAGRAKLSKRMVARLNYLLHEFYEKVGE